MTPESLAARLLELFPDLVVSLDEQTSCTEASIAIHPEGFGHPQVNIRFHGDRIEWQGYWGEFRWGHPLGHAIGREDFNYVMPSSWGRANDPIKVTLDDPEASDVLELLTQDWFEQHPPEEGFTACPPVPAGYRLATLDEMVAGECSRQEIAEGLRLAGVNGEANQ